MVVGLCRQSPTDFHAVEAKKETREDHLAQAIARPKGRKEGNRSDTEKIDEENGQEAIYEAQVKHRYSEGTNRKRRYDQIG